MITKEVIVSGATTDEAINKGCEELGLSRDEVQFEILELPRQKVFGLLGGSPATVRVYVDEPEPEEEEIEEDAAEEYDVESIDTVVTNPRVGDGGTDPASKAADYLDGIIKAMGLENVNIDISYLEDGSGAELNLSGDGLGNIIGRHGETLTSLQYLVSLVANSTGGEYFRIAINIGNYREKREDSLINLAKKTALRSLKISRNLALDPMNPYERRIIHTAMQEIEGATSWSVGEGGKRHVVIGPVGMDEGSEGLPVNHGKSYNNRGSYGNNRGGYGNRGSYNNRGGYNRGGYNNRGYNNRGGYNRGGYNNRGYNDYNRGYNNDGGDDYNEDRGYNRQNRYGDGHNYQSNRDYYDNRGGYHQRGFNTYNSYNEENQSPDDINMNVENEAMMDSENTSYQNDGYNRDNGYRRNNNYRGGGYNNRGYNRDNGGYRRNNYQGGGRYNNRQDNSGAASEPREARRDSSAPLYGRIEIPKKNSDNENNE